jgi:hypothetical protein
MSWMILGDSVTGTSHIANGQSCQDAFRTNVVEPERYLVIALSDGAGSAAHSDIGATYVCDEFIRRITLAPKTELFSVSTIKALFADVRNGLFMEAQHRGLSARDLACTALLVVLGQDQAMFAQVGDGAIVFKVDEDYQLAFWPESAEYVNTTDFLTDELYEQRIQVSVVSQHIVEVCALTDGLQRLALDYASKVPYRDFFSPLFRRLIEADDVESLRSPFREFLSSERICARTDDDKTLVVAVRK